MRRSSGFTLIELLLVVAIITILIALLMPALASAREAANVAKCLSHQRTFAHGTHTYALDHNGWVPRGAWGDARFTTFELREYFGVPTGDVPDPQDPCGGLSVQGMLAWLDKADLYKCPSLKFEFPQHYAVNTCDFAYRREDPHTPVHQEVNHIVPERPDRGVSRVMREVMRPDATAMMTEVNANWLAHQPDDRTRIAYLNVWWWEDLPFNYLSGDPNHLPRMIPGDDKTRHRHAQTVAYFDNHAAVLAHDPENFPRGLIDGVNF